MGIMEEKAFDSTIFLKITMVMLAIIIILTTWWLIIRLGAP